MADDPKKKKQDSKLVAGTQDYEVKYLARTHDVSQAEALRAIKAAGPSRAKIDAYLKKHSK